MQVLIVDRKSDDNNNKKNNVHSAWRPISGSINSTFLSNERTNHRVLVIHSHTIYLLLEIILRYLSRKHPHTLHDVSVPGQLFAVDSYNI